MTFVDASVIVAILKEEPGYEELVKRLDRSGGKYYVSPMVRFEAVAAMVKTEIDGKKGKTVNRRELFATARSLVAEFIDLIGARDVMIDARIGEGALEAMATFGKLAGHKAQLNLGDCFSYAAAKSMRLELLYKGNDFVETDIG
ncbi:MULTISPECIES: type II toxin-antitoxin system VapC family toxin [Agrobacterium]|jgi:ribonuclease VapC|uniref:VapC ribonuclease n=1 Tax=Agrobacterium pusense TaxID=648995 RepID=U4QFU1_9HYPH|nr:MULTISPECIES: type II toxin-antitoxin system VapC family toxin [Agrobacterium]MBA8801624.1 ribonuclease VapC [Agrobacterium sp. RC10-4-1]MBW9060305.1 type II toxin-antitoxin system VapC family toxin [Agrobacterium pusense]MBW9081214.1 type II toxin-antitoxin system VapC family toxin [Agrobacterium pusense]OOO22905.1 VapC toxin family PIN domain ribonuclease [Agrobacterium pusense]WKD47781.1 type II toxin-antitoxin system VapC family toxin [Agrobacterium pusense]